MSELLYSMPEENKRTVSQEDLTLALRRIRVCCGIRLPQLVVCFDVNLRTLVQSLEIVIRSRIEREDGMP